MHLRSNKLNYYYYLCDIWFGQVRLVQGVFQGKISLGQYLGGLILFIKVRLKYVSLWFINNLEYLLYFSLAWFRLFSRVKLGQDKSKGSLISCAFQPRLVQAVFQGNYEEVENLLMKSMAGNMSDAEKRTPLHAAAFRGFAEIAGNFKQYPNLA